MDEDQYEECSRCGHEKWEHSIVFPKAGCNHVWPNGTECICDGFAHIVDVGTHG